VVQLQHVEQYSELAVDDMLLSTYISVTSDVHSLRTTYHSFAQSLPSRKELPQLLSKDLTTFEGLSYYLLSLSVLLVAKDDVFIRSMTTRCCHNLCALWPSIQRTTDHRADIVSWIFSKRYSSRLIEVVAGFLSQRYLDLYSGSKILKDSLRSTKHL
jgi:hypothetical protein